MKHSINCSLFFLGWFGLFVVVSSRSLNKQGETYVDFFADASEYLSQGYPIEKIQEYNKGQGGEYELSHHSSHGEKGDKGYKNYHKNARGKIAHSDQSQYSGQQKEEGGHKKAHHDEGNKHHYGFYEEKGEKDQKYDRRGGFKKGHNTKGVHNIHKLNEYKKNKEFFDEDYEEENYEKHGGHHHKTGLGEGKSFKFGHNNGEYELGHYGKKVREGDLFHYLEQLEKENRRGDHGYHGEEEKFGKKKNIGHQFLWAHGFKGL